MDKYINPRIGHIKLVDLKPLEVQTMYYELLKNGRQNSNKPLNPKTVIQTHRILRKALKNAVKLQIIDSNPCDYVETPKKKTYKHDILHEHEIKDFIDSFKDTEIYIAIVMAITLGLRRGELLALTWNDINFNRKLLVINKSLVYANRKVKVDTVKTEKSNRVLMVSDSLLNILKEEKEKRSALDNDYVILSLKGERFNPSSFARRYTELRERKEVKPIRFHDLRHTNATIMYKAGVKTKVMQERLGHSNISTTLDIYTHLFKEDQKQVSSILDSKIFG